MAKTHHHSSRSRFWKRLAALSDQPRVALVAVTLIGLAGVFCVWQWVEAGPSIMITSNNLGSTIGGTNMIITGHGFHTSGTTHVLIDGQEALKAEVTAPTTIVVTTPPGSSGAKTVTVINPDGRRTHQDRAFTYSNLKPLITSLSPNHGPVTGGTTVTIHGHGFTATAVKVHIHTSVVTPKVIDDSTLTFVAPAQTKPVEANVAVTSPDGFWTSDDANYQYQ